MIAPNYSQTSVLSSKVQQPIQCGVTTGMRGIILDLCVKCILSSAIPSQDVIINEHLP